MKTFDLKQGANTFTLDKSGNVQQAGSAVARWGTDNNRIVLRKLDGSSTTIDDVVWRFNADNQLELWQGGSKAVNFNADPDADPLYTMKASASLAVRPVQQADFAFDLNGEWNLTGDHDMEWTVGGIKSTLDGFVADLDSRFRFHFSNKQNFFQSYELLFSGNWVPLDSTAGGSIVDQRGNPRLRFQYRGITGADRFFVLPGALTIKKGVHQLMYQYDKGGDTHQIEIAGYLQIGKGFEITYAVDRQSSGGGPGTTELRIAAKFTNNKLSGDLQLAVKRPDGGDGATLAIQGGFTGVRGGTTVAVGFSFQQTRLGNTTTSTFAFHGSIVANSSTAITWQFATTNAATQTFSLEVGVHIKLGPKLGALDADLNLQFAGGEVKSVRFLLGVTFP